MLRMENVSKTYRHRGHLVKALDGATLHIPGGDFVSVVGPSGSGKSTLLLMLGGMLSPSEGRVLLEAASVYDLTPAQRARMRREKVGFVFQTFNLVPYLSALENVQVPLFLARMDEKAQQDRAAALLERVGLADRMDHKPGELSVGQQQRVALARMLANDPAVILADEPTGNLDPETSRQIIGFLEEFHAEGKTIVMVTHDPRRAQRPGEPCGCKTGRLPASRPARTATGRPIVPWRNLSDKDIMNPKAAPCSSRSSIAPCMTKTIESETQATVDLMFRAFSDRTRLRILNLLRGGELCVCDIVAVLRAPAAADFPAPGVPAEGQAGGGSQVGAMEPLPPHPRRNGLPSETVGVPRKVLWRGV